QTLASYALLLLLGVGGSSMAPNTPRAATAVGRSAVRGAASPGLAGGEFSEESVRSWRHSPVAGALHGVNTSVPLVNHPAKRVFSMTAHQTQGKTLKGGNFIPTIKTA